MTKLVSSVNIFYFETILCSGRYHVSICACVLICGSPNQEWRIYRLSIKVLVHALKKMVIPDLYMKNNLSYFEGILCSMSYKSGHKCLKNGKLAMNQMLLIKHFQYSNGIETAFQEQIEGSLNLSPGTVN